MYTKILAIFMLAILASSSAYAAEDSPGFFGTIWNSVKNFANKTIDFLSGIGSVVDKAVGFLGFTPKPSAPSNNDLADKYKSGNLKEGDSYSYTVPSSGSGTSSANFEVKVVGFNQKVLRTDVSEADVRWYDVDVQGIEYRCNKCPINEETAGFVYKYDVTVFNRGSVEADNVQFKFCVDEPAGTYCTITGNVFVPPGEYVFTVEFPQHPIGVKDNKLISEVIHTGGIEQTFDVNVDVLVSNDHKIVDLGYRNIVRTVRECETKETTFGTYESCKNVIKTETLYYCPNGQQVSSNSPNSCSFEDPVDTDDKDNRTIILKKLTPQLQSTAGFDFG